MKAARVHALVVLALAVYGCASAPHEDGGGGGGEVVLRWHTASLAEINAICNAGIAAKHRKTVWGCYRRTFNQCTVYTAHPDAKEDPQLHDTLGHETRHCFVGAFHK